MNLVFKFLPLILVFSLFTNSILAQKDIRKADKQLELNAYDLAIKNYKAYLDENPDNGYAMVKLAEAYRQTNDLMKAVYWYEKAINSNGEIEPQFLLNYSHSLKKLGLYVKAKNRYESYAMIDPDVSAKYLNGCEKAISLLKAEEKFEIQPFDGNSSQSDFGPAMFNNNIVFSSFRNDLTRNSDKQNVSYILNVGNQLYVAPNKSNIEESDFAFLRPDFKEIYGIGPINYAANLTMVAYTKNNYANGSIQSESDESDLSIYVAQSESSGDFVNEYPFPYNEVEYSYAHPHLAFNSSAMYFSSNRQGGHGGFDIYVSYFKDDQWTNPENLGSEINSSSDEITPFLADDVLFFSSNNENGLGGFDVFQSVVSSGQWSSATNLGKGVNSPGDDYYLIKDQNEVYYFTSNRLGGAGKDDIYIASEKMEEEVIAAIDIPTAVNLESLEMSKIASGMLASVPTNDIAEQEQIMTSVSASESMSTISSNSTEKELDFFDGEDEFKLYDHFDLSLDGAKRKGAPSSVLDVSKYFIQIASLSKSKGSLNDFKNIESYGNIYRFFGTRTTKIRLGSFDSKADAEMALAKVIRAGFKDAFVTTATLSEAEFDLLSTGAVDFYSSEEVNVFKEQYKVRLAAYSDPLWFDTKELDYLNGDLEQWTKGQWTIFILSGFNTIQEAESARIKAVNRGFKEAEVVVDDKGVLKKVNSH